MNPQITKFKLLICSVCIISIMLVGCQQSQSGQTTSGTGTVPESIESIVPSETAMSSTADSTTDGETMQTKSITISVLNLSDVNIGMFSVLDPVTGEQLNLDSMEPGSSVSLECNWPSDIQEFHWALYNENGELCIDAATDVSEVNTSVALLLTGEGNIDDVKVISE